MKYNNAHNIPYLLGKTPSDDEQHQDGAESVSSKSENAENKNSVDDEEKQRENERLQMLKYAEVVNETLNRKTNKKIIHIAAFYGSADSIGILLEYGADPKAKLKGTRLTALHLAAQFGHLDACKVLVEHPKAWKNKRALLARDNKRRIPLILAVMNGHLDVVKWMLSTGCPAYTKDSSENSAIHYAAGYGWNDILQCLMAAPFADPGVFNMWKLSPFFIAMIKGHDLCASTLLETPSFDVNATDSDGKSILHYMVCACCLYPK